MNTLPDIYVTDRDFSRLQALVGQSEHPLAISLEEELTRAKRLQQSSIPPDIVTMNSQLIYRDLDSGKELAVSLVYPHEEDISQSKISILSPVGIALLGLKEGAQIDWPLANGRTKRIELLKVQYQPEAEGQYSL